ncbi:hypothetical protein INR49_019258 [Caranx melampygus]|nr:hypothetical protein INR49_019258 [Caranx melampygus]
MCAVRFLRLEEMMENLNQDQGLSLEPQGLLYVQLRFIDTVVERQPKLRRQRCIFTKERGKNFLRAAQMNMNFATWGHLMMSILPRYSSFTTFSSTLCTTPEPRPPENEAPPTTALPGEAPVIRLSIAEEQPPPTSVTQGDDPPPTTTTTIITTEQKPSSVSLRQQQQQQQQQQQMHMDDFRYISVLGRGHFGKVLLGVCPARSGVPSSE